MPMTDRGVRVAMTMLTTALDHYQGGTPLAETEALLGETFLYEADEDSPLTGLELLGETFTALGVALALIAYSDPETGQVALDAVGHAVTEVVAQCVRELVARWESPESRLQEIGVRLQQWQSRGSE